MLVLSRKASERILIGDEVVITVVRIGPNSVRIGIDAPQSMNIVREEVAGKIIEAVAEFPEAVDQSHVPALAGVVS